MKHTIIDVPQAKALLEQQPIVLDMRDLASFKRGHIPGARHLDEDLVQMLMRTGKRRQTTLLYCYHGNSSTDMARLLVGMGFSDLHELRGGWQAWQQAGQTQAAHANPAANPAANPVVGAEIRPKSGLPTNAENASASTAAMTPLMRAAAAGDLPGVVVLLDQGAELNAINQDGNNALWLACFSGNENLVRYLIQAEVNVDQANENGATALIYCASAGKAKLVEMLLEAGADPSLRTLDDFSALDLAADRQSFRLLRAATSAATSSAKAAKPTTAPPKASGSQTAVG